MSARVFAIYRACSRGGVAIGRPVPLTRFPLRVGRNRDRLLSMRPSKEVVQKHTLSNMADNFKVHQEKRKLRLNRAQEAIKIDRKKEKMYRLSELQRAAEELERELDDSDSEEENNYSVSSNMPHPNPPPQPLAIQVQEPRRSGWLLGKICLSVLGGVAAVVATPVVLGAVGFTSGGIAAGSIAAKLMSAAAVANGGGVAAGSAVAVCQSVGAAGLGLTGAATVGTTAAGATYLGSTAVEKLTEKDK